MTYGRGCGVVVATGVSAEIGKIAGMLNQNKNNESTVLQKSLDKFGKIISVVKGKKMVWRLGCIPERTFRSFQCKRKDLCIANSGF